MYVHGMPYWCGTRHVLLCPFLTSCEVRDFFSPVWSFQKLHLHFLRLVKHEYGRFVYFVYFAEKDLQQITKEATPANRRANEREIDTSIEYTARGCCFMSHCMLFLLKNCT